MPDPTHDWNDDDYRDRSRFQLETMMTRHATEGEEQPYAGTFAAFATEGVGHEALSNTANLAQALGRCDASAMVPGTSITLVDAVRAFVDDALPTPYWHAIQGLPHPAGGIWSSPPLCQ